MSDRRLVAFSMFFPLYFVIAFYNEFTLFYYYPRVGEVHLDYQLTTLGPSMGFYGWIVAASIAAALSALLAPATWRDTLWLGWLWLGPTIASLFSFLYMGRWLAPGTLD